MNTINQRIQELINKLGITKTEFAKTLKVSQPYISQLVNTGTPSDILIESICIKYEINEDWLRYGTGEMFISKTFNEETYGKFGHLMEHASPEKRAFASCLISLIDRLPDKEFKRLTYEYEKALKEAQEEN